MVNIWIRFSLMVAILDFDWELFSLSFLEYQISTPWPKIHTFWHISCQYQMVLSSMVEEPYSRTAAILDCTVRPPGNKWISVKQVFELFNASSSWFNWYKRLKPMQNNHYTSFKMVNICMRFSLISAAILDFDMKPFILRFSNHQIQIPWPKLHTFCHISCQDQMILSSMVEEPYSRTAAILDCAVRPPRADAASWIRFWKTSDPYQPLCQV